MLPPRPTEVLHQFLSTYVNAGDLVIDATAGNGHDTVFLANLVGSSGRVLATDIQAEAIESTKQRLSTENLLSNVELHLLCHSRLSELAEPATASAVIFNLGYLPGANHELITSSETTTAALSAACSLLKPGGVVGVVCYIGHEGGQREADAVVDFLETQKGFSTSRYQIIGTKRPAPFLLFSVKSL